MRRPAVFLLPAQAEDLDSRIVAAAERLGTALDRLLREASRAEGLSPLQARVLVLLLQHGRDAPRAGALARAFDVTPPTLSDAVSALAGRGLVRRAPAGSPAGRIPRGPGSAAAARSGSRRSPRCWAGSRRSSATGW
jgi:DNA-binding transcriptional ArsR family regulator